MMQVTQYTILKTLEKKGRVSHDEIRKLLLLVIPRITKVSPNHSPDELKEEYSLVKRELEELCPNETWRKDDTIKLGTGKCRILIGNLLQSMEEKREKIPRLLLMYFKVVDAVL